MVASMSHPFQSDISSTIAQAADEFAPFLRPAMFTESDIAPSVLDLSLGGTDSYSDNFVPVNPVLYFTTPYRNLSPV